MKLKVAITFQGEKKGLDLREGEYIWLSEYEERAAPACKYAIISSPMYNKSTDKTTFYAESIYDRNIIGSGLTIFDPKTKTLYDVEELEGPFRNGDSWQYNLPKKEGEK